MINRLLQIHVKEIKNLISYDTYYRLEEKNPVNMVGMTPLHGAAMNGHLDVYKLLIGYAIDKNPPMNYHTNWTPLHYAAYHGHLEICKLILSNIEDKLPRDSNGVTPLHIAAERKHLDVFDLFLENIKVHPLDNQGRSPSDIMRSHSDNLFSFDRKTSILVLLFTLISGIFIGFVFMHE